jgi:hypothetical protein
MRTFELGNLDALEAVELAERSDARVLVPMQFDMVRAVPPRPIRRSNSARAISHRARGRSGTDLGLEDVQDAAEDDAI